MKEIKAIDAWCQPFHPDFFSKTPEVVRLLQQSKSPYLDQKVPLTPKETLKLMDEAGIDKLMLCAWNRPNQVILSNELIKTYVDENPDRFIGVVSVNLEDPVGAVKTLEHYVRNEGFKALRIVQWLWKLPPTHALYYPLYVKCVELDIPVCLQVGHTGPLMPSETGRPVPYIDEIALQFPTLKIVCGHIGYPWTDEMIGVAWKHPNVYIDTSAYLPRYYPPSLLHYMKTYGKHKVMFGTNFPQLTFKACMQQVMELDLDQDILQLFLWKNAQRIFKLDAPNDPSGSGRNKIPSKL